MDVTAARAGGGRGICAHAQARRAQGVESALYGFTPEDQFDIKSSYLTKHPRKGGLGVPLVAARIYYGVTAVIRFVGRRRVVSFEDGSSACWC